MSTALRVNLPSSMADHELSEAWRMAPAKLLIGKNRSLSPVESDRNSVIGK